ncbi:MAG: hypothetical protein ABJI69_06250 [Balneola sp.]
MGVSYILVNYTKKEYVIFDKVPASKARELAGNPASAAISTWYMLNNIGDDISFISDTHNEWPFPEGSRDDLVNYKEVTNEIVSSLISEDILIDEGKEFPFEDDHNVYFRKLHNIWLK